MFFNHHRQAVVHTFLCYCMGAMCLLMGGELVAQSNTTSLWSMERGLQELERQYECAFLYEPAVVKGQRIEPDWLDDHWTLKSILRRLSEETSLQFQEIEDGFWVVQPSHPYGRISGTVLDKEGVPLVGASVFHPSSGRGTATDHLGRYDFWVPAGDVNLQVSYIGFQRLEASFWVPFGQQVKHSFELEQSVDLAEIVVWANPVRSLASVASGTPAEQVTQEDMVRMPTTELAQLLQFSAPSFHATYQTVSDGTDHIDPAALRGLGPDQMIVLVNGHRRHSSALVNVNSTLGRGTVATDLNSIPVSAIERIEILPDGATARYGADAIAGVINLVLKDSTSSSSISLLSGMTLAGDGLRLGWSGHWRIKQSAKGYLGLSWRLDKRSAVNRSGDYTGPIFGDSRDENPDSVEAFFAQTGFAGQRVMEVGSAAIQNGGFLLNHEQRINSKWQFYQFGGMNWREGQSHGFYRFPYQHAKQSGRYPWGFSPEIHPRILDASCLAGTRGRWGRWQLDISQNMGLNSVDLFVHNSNNASMGLLSPRSASVGRLRYGQLIWQADASHRSPDEKTYWQIGTSMRNEFFQQLTGDEWSWQNYGDTTASGIPREAGIQVFPGYRPENTVRAWRSSLASYIQVNQTFGERWFPSLAVRVEHWPDAGTFLTGKLSVQYRWLDRLRVRAAFNTGLRPPALAQVYFSSQSLQFVPEGSKLIGQEIAQLNSMHPLVNSLVGSSLQPERSYNYSMGLSWPFSRAGILQLTAYRISIQDRIVLGSHLGPSDTRFIADLLTAYDLGEVQFFTNAVQTLTHGMDVSFQQEWKIGNKKLGARIAATLNRTRVAAVQLAPTLRGLESQLFNREDQARLEFAQPGSKWITQLDWTSTQWNLSLQMTRFGAVTYWHPNDGHAANWVINEWTGTAQTRDQTFQAKWVTDLSVRWFARKHWSLGLQCRNLFNVYPDTHQHSANTNDGVFKYSRYVQQFGVWGTHALLNWQINW